MPPSAASSVNIPQPQQSPPTLNLPLATYATPGGVGATANVPPNGVPSTGAVAANDAAAANVMGAGAMPTQHQPQLQQPQPPMNINEQQMLQFFAAGRYQTQYGAPPGSMMPGAPAMPPTYLQTPLSPAFDNESNGPPAGTVPGTPGPQTNRPMYIPPLPGQPQQPPITMTVPPGMIFQTPGLQMMPPGGMPPGGMPPGGMTPGGMPPQMPPQFPGMPNMTIPSGIVIPPSLSPEQPALTNHISIPTSLYSSGTPDQRPRDRIMHQEIKLEIICKGLRDRDITSKSDPVCVVFLENRNYSAYGAYSSFYPSSAGAEFPSPNNPTNQTVDSHLSWKEVGRTECIKNCLSPHFKVQVTVPYHFEELQHIRLGLWDIDSKKQDLKTHDFLGDVRTTVAELVMAGVWESPLTSKEPKDLKTAFGGRRDLGKITVIVHEGRDGGNMLIKASMSGKKLDRKDFFISSDPYFIVSQLGKNAASRSQLYKSEVVRRTVNPTWRPFQFKVAIPKGGGKQDIRLEILVYDKDNHRRDDEIGKSVYSLADLEKNSSVAVVNEQRKKKRRGYKNSGTLELNNFQVIAMPSLVDYLQGGLKLHFSVAIDMTASNGGPNDPTSLHFQDYYGNRYTRALGAIINVLDRYQTDKMFAAFGFGAELPGNPGFTSSCFPLSLGQDPMCQGVNGILEAYRRALHSVRFSGPTNFAPLIETVSRKAKQRINTQTDQNYDVLLILTDGVVSDFELTVDRIIAASHMPLSIIIVGIGTRNFRKMKELDSDDTLLTTADGARHAVRDICQFVDFAEYERSPPERLGAAVLAEMPGNIVEYFVGICSPPIHPGQRPKHLSSS